MNRKKNALWMALVCGLLSVIIASFLSSEFVTTINLTGKIYIEGLSQTVLLWSEIFITISFAIIAGVFIPSIEKHTSASPCFFYIGGFRFILLALLLWTYWNFGWNPVLNQAKGHNLTGIIMILGLSLIQSISFILAGFSPTWPWN